MTIPRFKTLSLAVALLLPLLLPAQTFNRPKRPVAVETSAGGDLFVLDASGKVLRLKVTAQGLTSAGDFPLSPPLSPTDLALAVSVEQPVVLVTSDNQRSGFLTQYSLEGKVQKTWVFPRLVLGLDVDRNSKIAYVTSFDVPQIYSVSLQQTPRTKEGHDPEFVTEVLGARRLGPLTVDSRRGRLYLGDIEAGQIFQFDMKTGKSTVIARDLASPQALLVSADGSRLYIADASRRKVYGLDLKTPGSTPKVFSSLRQFRSPAGLAMLEDGRLVVADEQAGVLFVLSQQGTIQSVFRL